MTDANPPPIIDSARVLIYAHVPEDMKYTGAIHLYVGGERLGAVPSLAICRNYYAPGDIVLLFCDRAWNCLGCAGLKSLEEAMLKAERGYPGISAHWQKSMYDEAAVNEFLREVYEVDPTSEWWLFRCSFCRNEVEGQAITKGWGIICLSCVN